MHQNKKKCGRKATQNERKSFDKCSLFVTKVTPMTVMINLEQCLIQPFKKNVAIKQLQLTFDLISCVVLKFSW